jgi:hypothetical protein
MNASVVICSQVGNVDEKLKPIDSLALSIFYLRPPFFLSCQLSKKPTDRLVFNNNQAGYDEDEG